jgi:hypothetical protein
VFFKVVVDVRESRKEISSTDAVSVFQVLCYKSIEKKV